MAAAPATTLPLHRMDVETYNRIVASGALEGQHVELLDGAIVDMSPKSPAHIAVVSELVRHFAAAPQWWMQVQDPIEVGADSEPEPDLAIAAERPPRGRLLRTAVLVVEVAVSSQALDRNVKAPLYARAGIPTYWLIDVPARAVEVRTEPAAHEDGRTAHEPAAHAHTPHAHTPHGRTAHEPAAHAHTPHGRTAQEPAAHGYQSVKTYRAGEAVPCPLEGVADLDVAALHANVED